LKKKDYKTSNGVWGNDKESKLIEKHLKTFENYQKERADLRKKINDPDIYKKKTIELEKKFMGNWNYLSNRPLTNFAEDLLKCWKEGSLIEELVFGLASWTKREQNLASVLNKVRIDEFNDTFRNFSECFFINGNNQEAPEYWKRAKLIRPDFDIWILTLDPGNISKGKFEAICDNHPNKIYILPDYKCNTDVANDSKSIYLAKNEISELKKQDFVIKKDQIKDISFKRDLKAYFLGFVSSLILFGIYYNIAKKFLTNNKENKNKNFIKKKAKAKNVFI
jgi:hypothetical protein